MKRCKLKILTKNGTLEVPAYNVGNGVYVHRFVRENKPSTKNSWTISAECGHSLMHFTNKPCLLKEVMAKAQELTILDWTFTEKEWRTMDHDPYQELIYKIK